MMLFKNFLLATVAVASTTASLPAVAAPLLFELSGSRSATFSFDPATLTPNFFSQSAFGDQVSYDNVVGIFGGIAGTGSVGFGTGLFAALNVNNPNLGFTQFSGPALFTVVNARPVFNIGTFSLTSIVSGASTLRISTAAAAAVPEPVTWAMMLVGFGMIGASVRYRRRSTTAVFA